MPRTPRQIGRILNFVLRSDAQIMKKIRGDEAYLQGFMLGAMFGSKYPEDVVHLVGEAGMNSAVFDQFTALLDDLHHSPEIFIGE